MRWMIAVLLVSASLGAACDTGRAPEVPPASDTVGKLDAIANLAGMCTEHGVLEAVCTKCNPALVPIFQAKGDWCPEHQFPESICPICHPERGGRPTTDVSADPAPATGTRIRFTTLDTARRAGLETVEALARPSSAGITAVGRITYDATQVAQVNARATGVVRAIHVNVGTRVRRGAPLARIESAAVGADQSRLAATKAQMTLAETNLQRAKDLFAKGIIPSKEVMDAEQEFQAAQAEHSAALHALRVVGGDIEDGLYTVTAPLAGIVTQRNTSIGAVVDMEHALFEIVNPSTMWVEIDVRESHVAAVRVGQTIVLTVDQIAGREFTGKIDYVAPAVDARTRTVMARARLANPDSILRANMYARVRIASHEARHSVVVPRTAVQQAKGVSLAFVRLAEDLYETRRVDVRPTSGDLVELAGGVEPGEFVVTSGSFLLKTETLKGSIGAGCCEIEPKK